MVKRAILALFLSFLAPIIVVGAQSTIGINQFSGLNTQDNPSSLQPSQSQDLLNVRLQPGGRSVYKRDGYGLFQGLGSGQPVHGGYHFQQTGGSDVQLWGSSNTLYSSVNDAPFVAVATGTLGATWQCTDNLGFAYCVTSANDEPVKTDGTVANTSYQPTIPAGTIIASTPLQLIVGGVSGNASSIYFSANNNFVNFTVGPLPTDPYIEIINAPGSRLTNLGYYFGNVYWWKDQSLGFVSGSSAQGTVGITIVSNQIGTIDNSSAFWNPTTYDQGNKFNTGAQTTSAGNPYFNEMSSLGGIFFRGQDNHIYQYDGYTLTRLSRIITPNITSSSRRKSNSWTQSTQADWQSGIGTPTSNFSYTISPGDVFMSSFSATDTVLADFSQGSGINITYEANDLILSTNSASMNNGSFETADFSSWTVVGVIPGVTTSVTGTGGACNIIAAQDGTYFGSSGSGINEPVMNVFFSVWDASTNIGISTTTIAWTQSCSWTSRSITVGSTYNRKALKIAISASSSNFGSIISNSFISNGGNVTFYTAATNTCSLAQCQEMGFDNFSGGFVSSISSANFISQVFDTTMTSSTVQGSADWTVNGFTPYFEVQTSSNSTTGPWVRLITSSGTTSIGNRYYRYVSSFTVPSNTYALTTLDDASIIARSTGGIYLSAVNNAPSIVTFGSFVSNDQTSGGTLTYWTRSATNSFTISSSTPTWIAQTKNSTVAVSTGTYFQARIDFVTSSSTSPFYLSDFTFNWFEGAASDKAYIQYFQDAVLFSVSSGSGTSTNNTIFYLDLLNNTWLKDNIAANGFAVENNTLYIGDPLSANIYKFGGVATDKGSAIQSYWKSKDFTGDDPTVKNDYNQADFSFAESSNTVAFTYTIDQGTSTTFIDTIPLYSPSSSILKRGFALDRSAVGTYYNFSVGDNSSLPSWKLMGQRTTYIPLPWRPQVSN